MSVATVRAALGTALRTVDGLANVSDYMADTINPPHAMFDFAVEPHLTFGLISEGSAVFRFTVQVFVSRSDVLSGQRLLDKLRDPTSTTSLAYVVENNATLAAACDYARVSSIGAIQIANPSPNVEFLMVPFEIEVGV
jgi:hypothetical protein